ncbi:MAG: NAD-dependent protein deacylase [Lachnospiraceae bacterium]|nr:NAD-dependent protein deacylase [Lachnospiraceae bacterium]
MKGSRQSLDYEQNIERLNDIIRESEHIAFLGGAGVSTESGIPDFRSKDGLYRKTEKRFRSYRPEYLLSHECLRSEPEVFFDYFRRNLDARQVLPNAAHLKLAEMERAGKLDGIVTQNIDGLHQKAGSKAVWEIHGSAMHSHCISCGKTFDADFVFDNQEKTPHCPDCGKMVRPDVTLYGEMLPDEAYENAVNLMNTADCLIIGGTSLEVGSAARMAHLFHGPHLIIINKGKTKMEAMAELVFHDSIGKVLSEIRL